MATVRLIFAGGLVTLSLLGGCGSSTPKPDPARLAQVLAETNALCTSLLHRNPSPAQQHRQAVLTKALDEAAAYLPVGRSLDEAHTKRRALEKEIAHAERRALEKERSPVSGRYDFIERFYRLQLQIYEDYKALGISKRCLRPPRPPISG